LVKKTKGILGVKPLGAHICPLEAHLCPLELNYVPWSSFMHIGLKYMPPSSARTPPMRACPGALLSPLGLIYVIWGLFYVPWGSSAHPLSGVRAPLFRRARLPLSVHAPSQACTPSLVYIPCPSMQTPLFIHSCLLFICVCPYFIRGGPLGSRMCPRDVITDVFG
jgi:hypothetical protein